MALPACPMTIELDSTRRIEIRGQELSRAGMTVMAQTSESGYECT